MECWRLLIDAANPKPGDQFPGWPKTITMEENYGRKASAYLPRIVVKGMRNPVVQIVDERNNEIVYTLRINGTTFLPKVFAAGKYTVIVGDQDSGKLKRFRNVPSLAQGEERKLEVSF